LNKSYTKQANSSGSQSEQFLQSWLQEGDKRIDGRLLLDVFSTVYSYKWSILILFILGCIVGTMKAINEDPIYQANLTMSVEPNNFKGNHQFQGFNPYALRFYETQYEMIRSRTVAEAVVDRLGLVERTNLRSILVPPSFSYKLKASLSKLPLMNNFFPEPVLTMEEMDKEVFTDAERNSKRRWLTNVVKSGVQVKGTKVSQLIQVSFKSRDPEFAAEIANALVEAYINLQNYLKRNKSIGLAQSRAISSQQLSTLNQEYIQARTRYDELSKRYGAQHPRIVAARAERNSAQARYNSASRGVSGSKSKEFELSKLEREVDLNQKLYDLFLSKFRESDLNSGNQLSSARIVDAALPPTGAIYPNKQKIMLLWGIGGLFLGIVLSFIREQLDTTFKGPLQLEREMGLPLLGVVPKVVRKNSVVEREYLKNSTSAFSESINHIRTGVLYSDIYFDDVITSKRRQNDNIVKSSNFIITNG